MLSVESREAKNGLGLRTTAVPAAAVSIADRTNRFVVTDHKRSLSS